MSRDLTFEPKRPSVMLLAGDVMGDYELVATIHATGQVVGSAKFRVVNEWGDPDSSPNYWFAGERDLPGPQPTWGGGDPNGPQNVPTTPKNGRKNVVVVLVDTSDQVWSTTGTVISDAQRDWADNVANGVLGADGVTRSAADYYREVSYFDGVDGMDIVANVLTTVVHLPNPWTSYFVRDGNNNWKAVSTFCRTVMTTAGIPSFAGADMVVCVVQPVVGPPANIAWAYGGFTASGSAGNVTVNARGVVMSSTWGDGSTLDRGRRTHQVRDAHPRARTHPRPARRVQPGRAQPQRRCRQHQHELGSDGLGGPVAAFHGGTPVDARLDQAAVGEDLQLPIPGHARRRGGCPDPGRGGRSVPECVHRNRDTGRRRAQLLLRVSPSRDRRHRRRTADPRFAHRRHRRRGHVEYQARHSAPREAHRRRRRRPRCRAEVSRNRLHHTDFPGRLPARGGVDAAGHGPGPGSLRGGRQTRPHHQALAT